VIYFARRIEVSIFRMESFRDFLNFTLSCHFWGVFNFRLNFFNWILKWDKGLMSFLLRMSPRDLVLSTRGSPPLPRIRGDNRVGSLLGTWPLSSAFTATICDLVTLWWSVKASGSSFARLCKCIILRTSSSDSLVRGSKDYIPVAFHSISRHSSGCLYPPNVGKWSSSKTQSAYRAVWRSPAIGSMYLIMDGVS
jgi:hypothetical protein